MTQVIAEKPEAPKDIPARASTYKRLRIWPPIVLLALIWLAKLVPLVVGEEAATAYFPIFMFGPTLCVLGILLWWMFFSRAMFWERIIGLLGVIVIGAGTMSLAHVSVRNALFILMMTHILPITTTAFAAVLVLLGNTRPKVRTGGALLATLIAMDYWVLVRFEGLTGDFQSNIMWRWQPNAEEEFLKSLENNDPSKNSSSTQTESDAPLSVAWASFRSANRDSRVPGVVLKTDWRSTPPKELWRIRVGPSWSSFAVAGDLLFTLEQRGDEEAVVCYDADTGKQRWIHSYSSRFFEAMGGPGPRATPTISGDRLYTLGATGILHCLAPQSGEVIWQHDIKPDADRRPPIWGFSSSPLVTNDVVIVHAGGEKDRGVLAYDIGDGKLRWGAPSGDHSYSSPHLATIGDETVVLMVSNTGVSAINPQNGNTVWQHEIQFGNYAVLQPLVLDDSAILLGGGMQFGTVRLNLTNGSGPTKVQEDWTSKAMKSDFNDFVAHKGSLYGFDGTIFACVDIETGERQWKGGRYGKGQVLLLPDADQLLVLSEAGDIVLVSADPKELNELARHKVLTGKTWNHPVLVGDRLYVRNGEEAAGFQMPVE